MTHVTCMLVFMPVTTQRKFQISFSTANSLVRVYMATFDDNFRLPGSIPFLAGDKNSLF
jgi:hypothetical protein